MRICVKADQKEVVFQLNDSIAADELHAQLPLEIDVESFGSNEKIFYPPKKLSVVDAPVANARTGSLAYYAPWGNVVMFYGDFGKASGLYEVGHAVSGAEHIAGLGGTIRVEKADMD